MKALVSIMVGRECEDERERESREEGPTAKLAILKL
jgi:hypothetical protein